MKILITGTSGFIGFHTANKFIKDGHEVIGLDSMTFHISDAPRLHGTKTGNGIMKEPGPENMVVGDN